jgi:NTE family protein
MRTSIALSVGGAAGVAHLGAIEAIKAHRLDVAGVVGNSMGALVGALYATDPQGDAVLAMLDFQQAYREHAEQEAADGATAFGLLGFLALGPAGGLLGAAVGVAGVAPFDHQRMVHVLNERWRGASIEQLPLAFQTAYLIHSEAGIETRYVASGNLAEAVGSSAANPLLFTELDVRKGPIDPGIDRVLAVPVEQACAAFPDARVLAIDVTVNDAFISKTMACQSAVIRVELPKSAEQAFTDPAAFREVVNAGRAAVNRWFRTPPGRLFLATAARLPPALDTHVPSQ